MTIDPRLNAVHEALLDGRLRSLSEIVACLAPCADAQVDELLARYSPAALREASSAITHYGWILPGGPGENADLWHRDAGLREVITSPASDGTPICSTMYLRRAEVAWHRSNRHVWCVDHQGTAFILTLSTTARGLSAPMLIDTLHIRNFADIIRRKEGP